MPEIFHWTGLRLLFCVPLRPSSPGLFGNGSCRKFQPSLKGRSARQTAPTRVGELSIRYMRPFRTSPTDIYSYGTTVLGRPVEKNVHVRTTDSVNSLTVSSIEELNTRSMSLSACACDFLVAVGSHAPDTDSSRASSPSRHFVARARMGLRGGVRARINTVSTTVHRSLDAVARKKSQVLTPTASRVRKLSLFFRRMYLWTLSVCSDSHAVFTGTRSRHVVVSVSP